MTVIPDVAADEPQTKPPCDRPKAIYTPDALPPDSWVGKAPKSAVTHLDITIDKKGKVHDPVVIESGGPDVDKAAIEAVRRWRFTAAKCGEDAIETKIHVVVRITLR